MLPVMVAGIAKFLEWAKGLAPTSRESYFTILRSINQIIYGVDIPAAAKIVRAMRKESAQWLPKRLACVWSEVMEWTKLLDESGAVAILVTFTLGQRISDILQLQREDVEVREDMILITLRRGKMIPVIGAFTIGMPRNCTAAVKLEKILEERKTWLFLEKEMQMEKSDLQKMVAKKRNEIAKTINRDVRCLRRGGLQRMARAGVPTETLLYFSRHGNEAMLRRYLNEGKDLTDQHKKGIRAVQSSFCL